MTEQEFDQQVWRRFDLVTTDTDIETTVVNVCFTTRSIRIFVRNAPPEWLPCNRIVKHTTHKGDTADEGTIIEDLHNKVLKQQDEIDRLRAEKNLLAEKNSKSNMTNLLRAVNMLREGLQGKKAQIAKIDSGLEQLQDALQKIEAEP